MTDWAYVHLSVCMSVGFQLVMGITHGLVHHRSHGSPWTTPSSVLAGVHFSSLMVWLEVYSGDTVVTLLFFLTDGDR